MEVGAMEVGAMEVGAIEVGEMEVGAMEVEVVEVCWNEQLQQGRRPHLVSTLLLLLSPFLCESSSSPQCTHIPDSIFLLHALSLTNPPIPAATLPLSLLNALSHSHIPDYIFFIDALSPTNPPIPAAIPLSPSSTCFPIPAVTLLFLLDMLAP